jgi:hypothetical protein
MVKIYEKTNNSFMFLKGYYGDNITTYCKLIFDEQKLAKGVACIDFGIDKFIE